MPFLKLFGLTHNYPSFQELLLVYARQFPFIVDRAKNFQSSYRNVISKRKIIVFMFYSEFFCAVQGTVCNKAKNCGAINITARASFADKSKNPLKFWCAFF